jgi:phage shock protein C
MTTAPLFRPRGGRVFGGVCAGIATRFGWDVTIVRVVTVAAGLFTGFGAIAYIVMWIVVPSEV